MHKIEEERENGKEIRGKFKEIYKKAKNLCKREELRKGGEKCMDSISDSSQNILLNKKEILNRIKEYYSELYRTQNINSETIKEYLNGIECER